MTTAPQMPEILVIDDEAEIRHAYAQAFDLDGLAAQAFASAEAALEAVSAGFAGVVFSDIRMPGMDGMTLLARIQEIDPDLPVILVTGHADLALAVRAMRAGAHDFVEKPAGASRLVALARRALDYRRLALENRRLRSGRAGGAELAEQRLPGRNPALETARAQLVAVAASALDLVILGETGTGKGVAARLVHDLGERAARPYLTIDCAALSPERFEDDLVGHEAGAFPGAMRPRSGRLEHGRGGTIVLDGVQALTPAMQALLSQVIESRALTRIGGHDPIPLEARFIATAPYPLQPEVAAGRFRADLLYRLGGMSVALPRLADRREDIGTLFLHLVREAAARNGNAAPRVPPAMIAELAGRDWPGNIRELRNLAERYVLGLGPSVEAPAGAAPPLAEQVDAFERSAIAGALTAAGGSLRRTYEALGISRKTLYDKMQKHGLDRADFLPRRARD